MKTAVIAGATGLVGSELLVQLLADDRYDKVIALSRRDFSIDHPRLEKRIANLREPETALEGTRPDVVFCCLGTTMAKAGSKENFREVDFAYPVALARATHALGARRYLLVSALGADRKSRIYYNQVKGDVEAVIRDVGFQAYHVFRPSLLLGSRDEKRAGEDTAKTLYKVLGFLIPRKFKPIQARTVARAMLVAASSPETGFFIHESGEMQQYS